MTALLVLLGTLNLESLAVLLWAFFTPSESGRAVFLWLSRERLVLVALLLVIWLALMAATVYLVRSRSRAGRLLDALGRSLVDERRLAPALIFLIVVPVVMALAALLILCAPQDYDSYRTWAPDTFPLLRSVVAVSLPLLAFLAAASLSLAVFLVIRYRRLLFTPSLWSWNVLAAPLVVLLMGLLTAFHWLVLAFQLRFFTSIPGWYWIFDPVQFGAGDLYYILGALCLMGLAYWLLIIRSRMIVGLLMVVALGWFLQMGVGLMGGAGIATFRERFFTTYHAVYVEKASQSQLGILDGIRRYEEVYGSDTFTGTKAPGLMAFYSTLEHLVNGGLPSNDEQVRFARLSGAVMLFFPLFAAGTACALYGFMRLFLDNESGLAQRVAPILYVLIPNAALLTFFADQALYPLAFLVGVTLCILGIRRQSLLISLSIGALLYGAVFFTFTLIPLFAVTGAYLILHYWPSRAQRGLQHIIGHALALAAGALLMHLLAATLLNYDFLARLERGMTVHHNIDFYLRVGRQIPDGPEPFSARLGQIFRAAWFNNLDLAAAIGFPVYLLFVIQASRRIARFLRAATAPGEAVILALVAGFIGINLAGSEQGEVPRLWLFWVPMIVLLAACELEPWLRRQPRLLLALCLSQLVTVLLTFHFQDLRM